MLLCGTGARMLVIAIAGASSTVIHELTETAERCGLVPKVIPSVRELLTGGAQIEGFTATTHVSTMVHGEYTAQVTRQLPAIAGAPGGAAKASKQAVIGVISTPSFLAPIK